MLQRNASATDIPRKLVDRSRLRAVDVPLRPKVLTLTGCFTNQLGEILEGVYETTHLWRVTAPMLAGPHYAGRNFYPSDHAELSQRLNYELTDQHVRQVKSFAPNVVILDPASDFGMRYYTKDGKVISDLSSGLLFDGKPFPQDFPLQDWNVLEPASGAYVDLYAASLDDMIENDLFGDALIVVVHRKLCTKTIAASSLRVIDDPKITVMQDYIDEIVRRISCHDRVKIVDAGVSECYTHDRAPYGEWCFHPSEEYQLLFANKLLDLMGTGDACRTRVINRFIETSKQRYLAERLNLQEQLRAMTASRDEAAARLENCEAALASLQSEVEAAAADRARLTEQVNANAVERDGLRAQLQAIAAERDALAAPPALAQDA